MSAIANDVGTDVVFLRQLIAHARPEDVAVGISTSGGSRNVMAALAEARKRQLLTVALLGYDGGEIRRQGLADIYIVVGPTTSRASRRSRRRSTTSSARGWRRCAMPRVELFGTATCPYTRDLREWLELRGTEFDEYDVELDAAARERMRTLTGRRAHGARAGRGRSRGAGRLAGPRVHRRWLTP
jgi:Phosphoheptose isomerase